MNFKNLENAIFFKNAQKIYPKQNFNRAYLAVLPDGVLDYKIS